MDRLPLVCRPERVLIWHTPFPPDIEGTLTGRQILRCACASGWAREAVSL